MEGKEPSFVSQKKMVKAKEKTSMTTIDDLGEDLMQNVLNRLPALTFASASCVSHFWNRLCNRILFSCPKLSSAVSLDSSLQNAVKDVVDKVLSAPIRPHFALVSIGPSFNMEEALNLIGQKLGSSTPLIVNTPEGVIGTSAHSDKLVEMLWDTSDYEGFVPTLQQELDGDKGIVLTIGFLPGLRVHVVPLIKQQEQCLLIDEFITNIRETASSSDTDSSCPAGIILYAGLHTDIKPVLQIIECVFPQDTFVVGDGCSSFLYRSDDPITSESWPNTTVAAVALVFARDRGKSLGIGETQFHLLLSPGITPIGPRYKAVSVRTNHGRETTWLTASNGMGHQSLDGETLLEEISAELGDRIQFPVYYIGVAKRRRCSFGSERSQRLQFFELHAVTGGNEEYLFVDSIGIKTGDRFQFYVADSEAARSYCKKISEDLRDLNQSCGNKNRKVFGGMVFSCCGRGDGFLGPNFADSSPFAENFPGIPFSGTYCAGEIFRGKSGFYYEEEGNDRFYCNQHVYSAAYLVMSYSPPQPKSLV